MQQMKKKVTKAQLYRSVASSSAIETGLDIKEIEKRLKNKKAKFSHLSLAS